MHRSIRRVTLVTSGASGTSAEDIYRPKKKARKSTKAMRPVEQLMRRGLEAANEFSGVLLDGHNRSSRESRDGWLMDGPSNQMKATRKAFKRLVRF